jgi:hypothetical protein
VRKSFRYMGHKCHLVRELEDDGARLIVYKYWRPHKQRWQYMVDHKYIINHIVDANEK